MLFTSLSYDFILKVECHPVLRTSKVMFLLQASSWGNLKPGRGVFLKEECPVSSCVLASNRWEGAGAGAGAGAEV